MSTRAEILAYVEANPAPILDSTSGRRDSSDASPREAARRVQAAVADPAGRGLRDALLGLADALEPKPDPDPLTPTEEAIAKSLTDRHMGVTCDRPPVAWSCSRAVGHDGPCAATKIEGAQRTNDASPLITPSIDRGTHLESADGKWDLPKPKTETECPKCKDTGYVHCGDRHTGMSYQCTEFYKACPVWKKREAVEAAQEEAERCEELRVASEIRALVARFPSAKQVILERGATILEEAAAAKVGAR